VDTVQAWFAGRLPDGWFVEAAEVRSDRDEIVVVGRLELPDVDGDDEARAAAAAARAKRFREETRPQRVAIAGEAEHRFERKVSWGVSVGDQQFMFTHLAVPVMTRLRHPERAVLDTLLDAGVARSRSEALAWCVRLVGRNQEEWIQQLRDALAHVDKARHSGPAA
jgi:hypothetical protein